MGRFLQFQSEIADRLITDPWFDLIEVLTEKIGDIENKINLRMGSLGTVAIVVTPVMTVREPNIPGPYASDVKIVVRVMENVLFNQSATGTKKRALDTATAIMRSLHHFKPDSGDGVVICDAPTLVLDGQSNVLTYNIMFRGTVNLGLDDEPVVETPVITQAGGLATITCATDDASIYYTINSVNPPAAAGLNTPTQNTVRGTLYSDPFSVTAGQKILARSWKSSYQTSEVSSLTAT